MVRLSRSWILLAGSLAGERRQRALALRRSHLGRSHLGRSHLGRSHLGISRSHLGISRSHLGRFWSKVNRVVSNRVVSTGPAYPSKAKPGSNFDGLEPDFDGLELDCDGSWPELAGSGPVLPPPSANLAFWEQPRLIRPRSSFIACRTDRTCSDKKSG